MERIEELVVKPRDGFGGHGVTIMPRRRPSEQRRRRRPAARRPDRFVAQEMVPLSSHPTACAGRLRPRHVDLRPFVVSRADGGAACPAG